MRIKLILGVGGVVVLDAALAFLTSNPWATSIFPALACGWVLFTIYHAYLLERARRWPARKLVEDKNVENLGIPAIVSKPNDFAGVMEIDAAERYCLRSIPDLQGTLFAWGIVVASMPPLAVLLAALQAQAIRGPQLLVGLSGAEAAIMLAMIVIAKWAIPHPTKRWVPARTRGELLRRERYVCLAQVGPYLDLDAERQRETAGSRIQEIISADEKRLAALIPMRDEQQAWLDLLWRQAPSQQMPDVVARAECYLHYRIRKQVMWFDRNTNVKAKFEKRISRVVQGAVIFTVLTITLQIWLQLGHIARQPPWGTLVLALVLPPVCAFLLATAEMFSFAALAESYNRTKIDLVVYRHELERLIESGELAEEPRRFQALVLHAESILTEELRRWIMLTDRAEFRVTMG